MPGRDYPETHGEAARWHLWLAARDLQRARDEAANPRDHAAWAIALDLSFCMRSVMKARELAYLACPEKGLSAYEKDDVIHASHELEYLFRNFIRDSLRI